MRNASSLSVRETLVTAAIVPFLLFAYDRLVIGGEPADRRRRMLSVHLPAMAFVTVAGCVRLAVFLRVEASGLESLWRNALVEAGVVWRYVALLILPVGPVPQYEIAAGIINRLRIDCKHLITFNMDEYADENGQTAPADWAGSFATAMWEGCFSKIDPDLRPPEENIHFPNTDNIGEYSDMIAATGGADCCYGGIGWCGHCQLGPHLICRDGPVFPYPAVRDLMTVWEL